MMRRFALCLSFIALTSGAISVTYSMIALYFGGLAVLPAVTTMLMLNAVAFAVNLVTITLCSPGRDPLHYPRQALAWLRARRGSRVVRRSEEARQTDPVHLAWHAIVNPPHAMTDARRSRLENLRFRADVAVDRLDGSLDIGDIDTVILMQKTLGEVSSAYRAALTVVTTDKGRRAIDRSLEETLDRMVSAAESRLAASTQAVTDRFDAAIQHARSSSARIVDR